MKASETYCKIGIGRQDKMSGSIAGLKERIEIAAREQRPRLNLSGFALREVPFLPKELCNLRELDLSGNRISKFPEQLCEFRDLEILDLGNNQISDLGTAIGYLENLVSLDVSENWLKRLPDEISRCDRLCQLDLYANQLCDVTDVSSCLPNVTLLDASTNHIRRLDYIHLRFPKLRELDVSNNVLKTLPDGFSKLSSLRKLNLDANQLTSVDELRGMNHLVELYCSDNSIEIMPLEIAHLPHLRAFSAANNKFDNMPSDFDAVSDLRLRTAADAFIRDHIVGPELGKLYFNEPSVVFLFTLVLGGVVSVHRFVDLYYKRQKRRCKMTITFPSGTIVELDNLSRKTISQMLSKNVEDIVSGKCFVNAKSTRESDEVDEMVELVKTILARVPDVAITPKATHEPGVYVQNVNIVGSLSKQEVNVGDTIRIGSIDGSIVNIKSKLDSTSLNVGSNALEEGAQRAQLQELVSRLFRALEEVPAEQRSEAQKVVGAARELMSQVLEVNPDREATEVSAGGLLEAAKAVGSVVPIALDIVGAVKRFIAGG